jgi:hypothetical protein
MIGHCIAAFGFSYPFRSVPGYFNLITAKARLIADHSAGAPLAGQAVT